MPQQPKLLSGTILYICSALAVSLMLACTTVTSFLRPPATPSRFAAATAVTLPTNTPEAPTAPAISTPAAPVPTATFAPCADEQPIAERTVQHVHIHLYCGVSVSQSELIAKYVQAALDAMPADVNPAVDVFAFVDLDEGVTLQYEWMMSKGHYWVDLASLRESWKHASGQAESDAVFIYLPEGVHWSYFPESVGEVVLHEMHHVLQFRLTPSGSVPPKWVMEGGADAFAYAELYHDNSSRGAPPMPSSDKCDYPLKKLEHKSDAVPSGCYYEEGERAVTLLINQFGAIRYYDLFTQMRTGRTFSNVFSSVYDIPLADFYKRFDAYRLSKYQESPGFAEFHPPHRLSHPQ